MNEERIQFKIINNSNENDNIPKIISFPSNLPLKLNHFHFQYKNIIKTEKKKKMSLEGRKINEVKKVSF